MEVPSASNAVRAADQEQRRRRARSRAPPPSNTKAMVALSWKIASWGPVLGTRLLQFETVENVPLPGLVHVVSAKETKVPLSRNDSNLHRRKRMEQRGQRTFSPPDRTARGAPNGSGTISPRKRCPSLSHLRFLGWLLFPTASFRLSYKPTKARSICINLKLSFV